MTTYRIQPAWTLLSFGLVTPFLTAFFWMHDVTVLCFAVLLCLMALFNLTSHVVVDQQSVSTFFGFFPWLPHWRRTVRWADVIDVRATQNPFFVEGDILTIVARSSPGNQQKLRVPIAILARRNEFLKQLSTSLPDHVEFSPDLERWAEKVGLTPKWQLGVALALLLLLAGIVWLSSTVR